MLIFKKDRKVRIIPGFNGKPATGGTWSWRWMGAEETGEARSLFNCSAGPLLSFPLNFSSIKEGGFLGNILSLVLASPQSMYYLHCRPSTSVRDIRIQE